MAISVPTVGDEGELPQSLPELLTPNVPMTIETFNIIAPYALAMALVGLLESLMTAKLVDEITDTHSQKNQRVACSGCGKHSFRTLRWHGWLRDDRSDHDQRQGIGCQD